MTHYSSCTLAAVMGAAVGAGLTYMLLKDKDQLNDRLDEGMKAIDEAFDSLEQGVEEFFDEVDQALSGSDQANQEKTNGPTAPNPST